MANGKFVVYYRVSTTKQGQSGLGLDAQRETITRFLNGGDWELVGEFTEIESGKKPNRPQLLAAIEECKKHGAKLLIAKLDRLARNVHFVSGLMQSKVGFVACDLPEANDLTIHIMAAFAEHESKRIGERTKAALAVAKGRGVVLGKNGPANLKRNIEDRQQSAKDFAENLRPTISAFRNSGMSLRKITEQLNHLQVKTPCGKEGKKWGLTQVVRVVELLGI